MTIPDGTDPHDEPHRVVTSWPIGANLAVVFERSESRRHARLVLVEGEGGRAEELSCLASEDPVQDGWGFEGEEAAWVAAHVGWHVATGAPPDCGDNVPGCPCD